MPRTLTALAVLAAALTAAPAASAAGLTARGSTGQAYVLGAKRGQQLQLLSRTGRVVARGAADRFGSRVFRGVRPGRGYTVRAGRTRTRSFAVLRAGQNPPAAFFRGQRLKPGLNYVRMRDGVELAMTVRLPVGKTAADGPFPTLIEYSGYQTAAPKDLFAAIVTSVGTGKPITDPLVPSTATVVGSVIGPLLGFAVVSVQMRGSGCSGGAFELFGLPTTYDGYDAVEAVAAQRWVKGGKVGMVGISFSGITQLFTAGTRPPHLAAIAPMSVTDDLYAGTSFPGGIRNSGFATAWATERMADAQPAPGGGQPYARALTKAGDAHCRANQRLRLQSEDAVGILRRGKYRTRIFDGRSPTDWMSRITVPTFLIGQYQDEQTGGHFAEALAKLSRNRRVWLSLQNGVHADSLGPDTLTRWVEFLKLYVANQVPEIPPTVLALSGQLYSVLADAGASPVKQSRFAGTTDLAAARATFERDPRVRLLMDNGAGPAGPGTIGSAWEIDLGSWPAREIAPTTLYPAAGGGLTAERPAAESTVSYTGDPSARPLQTLPGDGAADAWKALPPYTWAPVAPGKGVGFTTAPLPADVVIAGSSSLDLQLASSAKDTDLQVTLSEVRPDGAETYVQNGWLRASQRKLDAKASTALDPVPTHRQADAAPLTPGKSTLVRVPILPVAHAFRAGSRIRLTVQAPGGDRPRWRFATIERGTTTNTLTLGGASASKLVLPVLGGITAQGTALPPARSLRGQPSRTYAAASNGG